MNVVDAAVLAILAVADIGLLVHLRRARARRIREDRMMRGLKLAVERELHGRPFAPAKPWSLRRAG
jgi:hypothetical protein